MLIWALNKEQSSAFVKVLESPPEPSEKLKEAAERYKKTIKSKEE